MGCRLLSTVYAHSAATAHTDITTDALADPIRLVLEFCDAPMCLHFTMTLLPFARAPLSSKLAPLSSSCSDSHKTVSACIQAETTCQCQISESDLVKFSQCTVASLSQAPPLARHVSGEISFSSHMRRLGHRLTPKQTKHIFNWS